MTTVEVTYGVTSLGRDRAGAAALLDLCRAHWGIENGLHGTRDGTFREDRCGVRRGSSPRMLASLRNVAVYVPRPRGESNLAAATRELAANPEKAVAMVSDSSSISA